MLFFIDSNVLIYTRDFRDLRKQRRATEWLSKLADHEAAVVNLQVLNEVRHVALRKLVHLSASDVRRWTDDLHAFGETVVDEDTSLQAWSIQARYRLSWFDCLLLSAAERLGCTHFLTEDMGAGRQIGSLMLVNPFEAEPNLSIIEG